MAFSSAEIFLRVGVIDRLSSGKLTVRAHSKLSQDEALAVAQKEIKAVRRRP